MPSCSWINRGWEKMTNRWIELWYYFKSAFKTLLFFEVLLYNGKSSTSRAKGLEIYTVRSAIKTMNTKGPKIVPCWTPLRPLCELLRHPSIFTLNVLNDKMSSIHSSNPPLTQSAQVCAIGDASGLYQMLWCSHNKLHRQDYLCQVLCSSHWGNQIYLYKDLGFLFRASWASHEDLALLIFEANWFAKVRWAA